MELLVLNMNKDHKAMDSANSAVLLDIRIARDVFLHHEEPGAVISLLVYLSRMYEAKVRNLVQKTSHAVDGSIIFRIFDLQSSPSSSSPMFAAACVDTQFSIIC